MDKAEANQFHIVLEGKYHEVDAALLAETIENFNTLINELNQELKQEFPLVLRVKTFDEGSFDIFFALFADPVTRATLFNILSFDTFSIASTVISTLSDILSIKQFLKGEKPKTIENTGDNQTKIENSKGDIKIINKKSGDILFNNPTINITINNTFNSLQNKTDIEGLSFITGKKEIDVNFLKDEFKQLAFGSVTKEIENIETNRTLLKKDMPLSIFKIVFDDKYKWQFVNSDGHKISATIRDKDFFEKVKNRELYFTNGDVIIADVEVFQEFNEIANAFENKSYVLLEVKDVKHQPNQAKLNL